MKETTQTSADSIASLVTILAIALFEYLNTVHYLVLLFSMFTYASYMAIRETGDYPGRALLQGHILATMCVLSYVEVSITGSRILEPAFAVLSAIPVCLIVYAVTYLVVGSIIYGNLGEFSREIEKRRVKKSRDPYGDRHAYRILNQDDSD